MGDLLMIGGANTEETDNAVSDAADLGRVLQENGQHGVAREVAKLESNLRAALNAEDLVQNREQEHRTLESSAMASVEVSNLQTSEPYNVLEVPKIRLD